jgi:hypothetical protein
MRPVFDEVWHASWSMEDSVMSGFDKGGERYMAFTRTMQSLLWRIVFEIILHA